MEWTNRGANQNQSSSQPASSTAHSSGSSGHSSSKTSAAFTSGHPKLSIALLYSITLLLVLLVSFLIVGNNNGVRENKFVDAKKFQAIFLNGGQVYFGKILNQNDKYIRINNIYYLRVNQQVQPNQSNNTANDVTLVKLGCELHGPDDEMLINRDQLVFWENLKSDGQVTKAIDEFVKANPDGQKCDTTTTTNSDSTKKP